MSTAESPGVRTSRLSCDEIASFGDKGFLRVGRLLPLDAVQRLRSGLERLGRDGEVNILDPSSVGDESETPEEPGVMRSLVQLWRRDEVFHDLVFHRILGAWAAQLVGARQVRLYNDNALIREPRAGGELKWHQDFPYWPFAQPNLVSAWIALDDVDESNGAMRMVVGSHLTGERLPTVLGTGRSFFRERRPMAVRELTDPAELGLDIEVVPLAAGEVSFHHCLTWHCSGPNTTDGWRRAYAVRYVGDGTVWLGDRRFPVYTSTEPMGLAPGDSVHGPNFPLIPVADE